MSFTVKKNQELQKGAFGETMVSEEHPIVQLKATNGIRDDVLQIIGGTGASIDVEDRQYRMDSGTSATGVSSVTSLATASYRAGQGMVARFTALFSEGQPLSIQAAGFISAEDSYSFGYLGDVFGIVYATFSTTEIQNLTITIPASGAESATVQIDGINYTVPLTAGAA